MKRDETQLRRQRGEINEMQFSSPPPALAPRSIAPSKENWKGEKKKRERDEKVRCTARRTFHMTNRDITRRGGRRTVLSSRAKLRTKGSILFSLSRNGPIRPLDFTLRSRYKTISISFAKGPPSPPSPARSLPKISSDISPGFGILHGPLYLALLWPSAPFSPRSRLARRISLQSSRANLARLLLDNTGVLAYSANIQDRIIITSVLPYVL